MKGLLVRDNRMWSRGVRPARHCNISAYAVKDRWYKRVVSVESVRSGLHCPPTNLGKVAMLEIMSTPVGQAVQPC